MTLIQYIYTLEGLIDPDLRNEDITIHQNEETFHFELEDIPFRFLISYIKRVEQNGDDCEVYLEESEV